jgi:hypothetical protein
LDLLSGYAAVYCSERLQSEVPRISVHGGHSRAGSLLMQAAVRTRARQSSQNSLKANFAECPERELRLNGVLGSPDAGSCIALPRSGGTALLPAGSSPQNRGSKVHKWSTADPWR